ncbi:MAG: DUF444 family protein [Candidatus Obscuribacterales bacterium]
MAKKDFKKPHGDKKAGETPHGESKPTTEAQAPDQEFQNLLVDWLNSPPERTRNSVVLPQPAYLDRTIDDRRRFMERAKPKITKDVLKQIIRGDSGIMDMTEGKPITRLANLLLSHELMRDCFVASESGMIYVPMNASTFAAGGNIEVPIGIDEPSWWPGRDKAGGGGGGSQAGEDDADIVYLPITYEEFVELLKLLFDLPFLKQTDEDKLLVYSMKMRGLKKTGPMARWDKVATAKARLERFKTMINARPDDFPGLTPDSYPSAEDFPFHKTDLRFKRVEERWDPDSKAVVFMNLDTSGSMAGEPLAIAKFYFLLNLIWLRTKYNTVAVVYIAHNHRAERIRSEADFFRVGENGGTAFAPTHELTWQIAQAEFGGDAWNKYSLHATDGFSFDGEDVISGWIAKLIRGGFNYFGYCEVDLGWGWGGMTEGMRSVQNTPSDVRQHCGWARCKTLDDVPEAMMKIMTGDRSAESE